GEAPALPIEDAVRLLLVAGGTEAVRPIPVPQPGRRIERDDGAGLEPCEPPGPARERDEAGTAREVERDVAGRGVVAVPRVEDDVAVERARSGRLGINDPRAHVDRVEVRGRDRAEGTGEACVGRALLRHMEDSASRRG